MECEFGVGLSWWGDGRPRGLASPLGRGGGHCGGLVSFLRVEGDIILEIDPGRGQNFGGEGFESSDWLEPQLLQLWLANHPGASHQHLLTRNTAA